MKKLTHIALTTMLCITIPAVNFGQTAPDLKSAADYAVLAATEISFAAPPSEITDLDVGLYPGFLSSITGLENLILTNGQILAADQDPESVLPQAKSDLEDAYLFAAGANEPAPATISGNQGGLTLAPGIYKSTSTLSIDDTPLTLDAQGNENAVWIFQIASSLTTTVGGDVVLMGGAKANNVYWQVGSSATIGNDTDFKGNILALVSISMNTGAEIEGRLLASTGAVTFAGGNTVIKPGESSICEDALISNFPTAQNVCEGEPYSIDFNSVVVENAIEEIWVVNPLTAGVIVNGIFTLDASYVGQVNITLTAVAETPCLDDQESLGFTVNPLPIINISGETEFCEGESTVLTASTGTSYLWSTNETTQSINVSQAGNYSVVVTDMNGCEGEAQVSVSYHPITIPSCPPNMNVLLTDDPITLTGGTPEIGGVYSGPGVTGTTFDPAIAGLGTHIITYILQDICGPQSCEFIIIVSEDPIICEDALISNFPTAQDVCEGDPYSIDFSSVVVENAIEEIWEVNPLTAGVIVNGIFTLNAGYVGQVDITLTAIAEIPCLDDQESISFTVIPIILPTCPPNMDVLLTDDPITLTGETPEGGIYAGPGVVGNTFDPAIAGLGEHTITYTIQDICGPQSCDFIIIVSQESVPPIPISNWALFLTIGLISIFIIIFYRRLA
jgi:hypothetical protein